MAVGALTFGVKRGAEESERVQSPESRMSMSAYRVVCAALIKRSSFIIMLGGDRKVYKEQTKVERYGRCDGCLFWVLSPCLSPGRPDLCPPSCSANVTRWHAVPQWNTCFFRLDGRTRTSALANITGHIAVCRFKL